MKPILSLLTAVFVSLGMFNLYTVENSTDETLEITTQETEYTENTTNETIENTTQETEYTENYNPEILAAAKVNPYIAEYLKLTTEDRKRAYEEFSKRPVPDYIDLDEVFGMPGFSVELDMETGRPKYETYKPIEVLVQEDPTQANYLPDLDELKNALKGTSKYYASPRAYIRNGCQIEDHACWYGEGAIGDFRFYESNKTTYGSFPKRKNFWTGTYYAKVCWHDGQHKCSTKNPPGSTIPINKVVTGKSVWLG